MLSAHDVAIAALNQVASNSYSEEHADSIPQPRYGSSGASIEPSKSNSTIFADTRDANGLSGLQFTSSNNSQSTVPDASTPPTSDGFSSQSQDSQSQLDQLLHLAAAEETHSRLSELRSPLTIATNAGQKRTIEGYAKTSGSSSSESPTIEKFGGHSRNTSTLSTASSIMSSREVNHSLSSP